MHGQNVLFRFAIVILLRLKVMV